MVREGSLSCVFMNTSTEPVSELRVGSVLVLERGNSSRNRKVIISSEERYVLKYEVTTTGVNPLAA